MLIDRSGVWTAISAGKLSELLQELMTDTLLMPSPVGNLAMLDSMTFEQVGYIDLANEKIAWYPRSPLSGPEEKQ